VNKSRINWSRYLGFMPADRIGARRAGARIGTRALGLAALAALASPVAVVAGGIAHAETPAMAGVRKLSGTIGPGYTISLKGVQGRTVKNLAHGKYIFVVRDRANIHNFTLNGPGIKNKTITGTGFVGTKTVTLSLRQGKYRFYCTVHPTVTGTFRVT
jgi:hypothetical protein